MSITDPQAIKFCNEQVRPMCERFRALKAEADAMLDTYNAGVGTTFYNGAGEVIDDGRAAEGVSVLTGNDVLLVITQVQAFQTQLDQSGVAAVISKPCVQPFNAS